MTGLSIQELSRQLRRAERAGNLSEAERIACILAPLLEPLYDELDNQGIVLSWECDR
jgi:hypothetical protein